MGTNSLNNVQEPTTLNVFFRANLLYPEGTLWFLKHGKIMPSEKDVSTET